ncbi:MAG: hypothetical protein V4654_12880 [Bdellovibrionota bacterium]
MEEKIVLRESSPADSEKLGKFFYDIPTQALLDVKIRRQIDFFSLYRRLQLKFHNYILEETNDIQNNEILGTASFLLQDTQVEKNNLNISYAFDLRISPQRKAVLNWSRHFLPRLQKLIKTEKVDHFITSINLESSQVINAFIRTKQKRSNKPFYELIRKFNLVSIHGFYPMIFKVNPYIKVGFLEKQDLKKFVRYLSEKVKTLDLAPTAMIDDLEKYIHESLIYSFRNFVVARDAKDNIVGVCYPLSSSLLQDYFPQSYNQQSNNFRQFLKFASFFRVGRKLTRPFSRTQKEQTLNFQFLHFLFFEHPEVLQAMVKYTFEQSRQNEFLVYTYEQSMYTHRPPIGTIHSETPHALYEIRTPEAIDAGEPPLKAKISKNLWLDGYMF